MSAAMKSATLIIDCYHEHTVIDLKEIDWLPGYTRNDVELRARQEVEARGNRGDSHLYYEGMTETSPGVFVVEAGS